MSSLSRATAGDKEEDVTATLNMEGPGRTGGSLLPSGAACCEVSPCAQDLHCVETGACYHTQGHTSHLNTLTALLYCSYITDSVDLISITVCVFNEKPF